ncbi:MAG TPA: glycosyltransferase [Candidatus Sulfotelmatobacter sp.]
MNIFVFGSSLTSTYWNGAATYYRGIYKNLHRLGHRVTFAEPAIYDRQKHRDAEISYAEIVVYETPRDIPRLLKQARRAEVIIKHSGIGADDSRLEDEVLDCRSQKNRVIFWDVDAPATLSRVESDPWDPFRAVIPEYDAIFTYGGGPAVVSHYDKFGAQKCVPIYNGLDPETHHPVAGDPSLSCDLAFVGHRLPDRETRVEEFLLKAAHLAPELSFVLGGEGWGGKNLPPNVRWIGHVGSERHNAVNCSARMVLNVNRESMAKVGFSPPTRVFEAAGAGACVITDAWAGVDQFFTPDSEILIANGAEEVVAHLRGRNTEQASTIGQAMMNRALRDHSYQSRAQQVHTELEKLLRTTKARKPRRKVSATQTISPLAA